MLPDGVEASKSLVLKVFGVLEGIAQASEGLGAREIEARVGIPRSTVQRILEALESIDILRQDSTTKKYDLGARIFRLGMVGIHRLNVASRAMSYMQDLRSSIGESVGLNIRLGDARIYVEQLESFHHLRAKAELGKPYPIHSGAAGRMLLASLDDAEIERILAHHEFSQEDPLPRSRGDMWRLIGEARQNGYTVAFEEIHEGINAIAAPVFSQTGDVSAVLVISGPVDRFHADAVLSARGPLLKAASALSADLGFVEGQLTALSGDSTPNGSGRYVQLGPTE